MIIHAQLRNAFRNKIYYLFNYYIFNYLKKSHIRKHAIFRNAQLRNKLDSLRNIVVYSSQILFPFGVVQYSLENIYISLVQKILKINN